MHYGDGYEILYQALLLNLHQFRCYTSRLTPEVQRCKGMSSPGSKPCMMVGYTHDSETLWRICDPEFQKVKAQTEVDFTEERNAHMLCQHGSNAIDIFGLPGDKECVAERDTGDETLRGQDSPTMQIGKRSTSHLYEDPNKEGENAHSRRIC